MLQDEIERIQLQIAAAEKQLADLPQPTDAEPKDVIVAVQRRTLERQTLAKREDIQEVITQFKKQLTEKQQQLDRQIARERQQEARERIDAATTQIEDIAQELRDLADKQKELIQQAFEVSQTVQSEWSKLYPRPPYTDINYSSYREKRLVSVIDTVLILKAPVLVQSQEYDRELEEYYLCGIDITK